MVVVAAAVGVADQGHGQINAINVHHLAHHHTLLRHHRRAVLRIQDQKLQRKGNITRLDQGLNLNLCTRFKS